MNIHSNHQQIVTRRGQVSSTVVLGLVVFAGPLKTLVTGDVDDADAFDARDQMFQRHALIFTDG